MDDQKHCDLKFHIPLSDLRCLWHDATDKQRIELIRSVIYTAPDMHTFLEKVKKDLASEEFLSHID